jgi:uncharacterized protein (TIGR03067 family)
MTLAARLSAPCAPAPLPKPDNPKTELKKLQGTWVITHQELAGSPRKVPGVVVEAVFTADRLAFQRLGRKTTEYAITLDLKKKPRTIDLKRPGTPTVFAGIYSLEGDTLKLCYFLSKAKDGSDRPKSFVTTGTRNGLMVMKRRKP